MAIGAFPLAKLGVLAMKQVSKPVANALKRSAKNHNFMRKYVVIPPAQIYHRLETTIKLLLLGLGRPSTVTPLTEEVAVELGGDMLGEFIVFSMAAAILITEYNRQSASSEKKEQALQDRLSAIEVRLDDTTILAEHQKAMIRSLEHQLAFNSSPIGKVRSMFRGKPTEPPPPSNEQPATTSSTNQQQVARPTADSQAPKLPRSTSLPFVETPSATLLERGMSEGKRAIGVER